MVNFINISQKLGLSPSSIAPSFNGFGSILLRVFPREDPG
jgi:hypothetical protein